MDPKRLIEIGSELEVERLRAGRSDAMPKGSEQAILAALGLPVVPPLPSSPPEPFIEALPTTAANSVARDGATALGAKLLSAKGVMAVLGLGVAGVLSAGAAWLGSADDGAPRAPSPQVLALSEHAAAPQAESEEPPRVEAVPVPPPSEPAPHARKALAPKPDSLPLELEAIEGARAALTRGDASRALKLLDQYAARFPKPRLGAEATLLRIEALVARGDRATATRLGKAFLEREPRSPYARRVRSLIGESTP